MLWIFLICVCVGLPITMTLIEIPQNRKNLQIKEIKALTELERVKQENYLLENSEMRKELEDIRRENEKYLEPNESKWLIEETKTDKESDK